MFEVAAAEDQRVGVAFGVFCGAGGVVGGKLTVAVDADRGASRPVRENKIESGFYSAALSEIAAVSADGNGRVTGEFVKKFGAFCSVSVVNNDDVSESGLFQIGGNGEYSFVGSVCRDYGDGAYIHVYHQSFKKITSVEEQ